MKKVILFLFLIVFSFLKSKTQNRIDIIGNGTYCTIKEDGVIKIVGSYRPYPIICNNDTTSISINIDWGITKRIYYSNCILISKIFVNNIQITSYTNLLNILGSIYPATGSGGGGGGSYTFAGNIVNQSGNNIIINQIQPDWTAISGLGAIANKPNIPILDSTQFVKLRDSNRYNNGFITPSFFFNNRGSGTKWSNFILGGYLVQKINDSTYTITRDNTTIQDSIRLNATIARFTGDSIKRDTSIANRVIGGSVDTIANVITLNKTNGSNINLQLRKAGGGGGGITNDTTKVAYTDSTGGITGKNTFITPNYLQKYLTNGIKNNYLKYIEVIPMQPSGEINVAIHGNYPLNYYGIYDRFNTKYVRYINSGSNNYGRLVIDSPGTYVLIQNIKQEISNSSSTPLTRYVLYAGINWQLKWQEPVDSAVKYILSNPLYYGSYTSQGGVGSNVNLASLTQTTFRNFNAKDTLYHLMFSGNSFTLTQDTFSRFFLVKLTDLGANITNSGGGGGTTDTTSLSNRINAKLDVARFVADSTNKQNSLNFLTNNKIDSVTINGDTTLLTFYRNGTSSYNIQLKRASGGVVGISTKWNNLNISGYQVQKINDSTYNISRDNTIIQDSIRINGKLDIARFTADSIRWDSAINKNILKVATDSNIGGIKIKDCSNFIISKDSTYIENISTDTTITLVRKIVIDTILKNEFLFTITGLYYNRNKIVDGIVLDGDYNPKKKKLYFSVGGDFAFKGIYSFDITNNTIIKELDKSQINNDTICISFQFINDSILYFNDIKKAVWQFNINSKIVSIVQQYPLKLNSNQIIYTWIKSGSDIYIIPGSGGFATKNNQVLYRTLQSEMLNKNIINDYIFIIDSVGRINVYNNLGILIKQSPRTFGSVWYIVKYNNDEYVLSSSFGIYIYNVTNNTVRSIVETPNIFGRPRGIFVENTCIISGKQNIGDYSYFSPLSNIYFNAVGSLNLKTKFPFYKTFDGYLSIRSASKMVEGVVKVGSNVNVDTFGIISVNLPFIDSTRFVRDSIRWDTAIANRIITQRVDTISNRIYYTKTNGKIDSLQLRLSANAGGASINNDSILHPYPYPYKDTIKLLSTTDKILQIGTNNQVAINLSESIKVSQLFNVQTNINENARNGKFVRYGNTFQTFANNQLLSSSDGINFAQYTTSQVIASNNAMTRVDALDLSGDSLLVLTSDGAGNFIFCILGSTGTTVLYRSSIFNITDAGGSFINNIAKVQILGSSLFLCNGAGFTNYLIKINLSNLSRQIIATTGSPAAFFKSTTNLYYLDYSGWAYEVNAPTTRIMRVSVNAVTDATFLENKYICASDYSGNVYVADLTSLQVVDFIPESYFGSDDISVFAYGSILYVLEGNATNLYAIGYQLNFASVVANAIAPFRFYNSLQDSAGSNGTNGQVLTSQNGKTLWSTPTQTYPLQSILIWGASASGAAQNPQLSFQSNNIGLALSGTGVTLPAGMYQITLVAGMPAIDNSAPYPISFFKFGLSATIDATFSTYNEIRGCINKASSPAGNTDVLNATFSITLTVTTSTIYYVTTYINRGTSAAMSGFVNIVRIK